MRSITQTIVLDRLQQALASRGVDMKRSAVLEIAAETFGFQDGNAFVAAMKEGRFDPPAAEILGASSHLGHPMTLMRDPVASSVYAVDMTALPPASRKARFGVSPYGNLLLLPEEGAVAPADPTSVPAVTSEKPSPIVYVVANDGTASDPEVARWKHLLDERYDIDVDCGPVLYADAWRMARIDGRLYFAITAGEEYESHEQAVLALRDFETYADERREAIERLGGIVRCGDDTFFGRIELEIMLPAELAKNVDDIADWHEAIAILLGADHESVVATFNPQVWVRDDALDTNPEGDTDFDVTVEVLLMGYRAARAVEDNRDSSDALQSAALAPAWIRDWQGPFYVEVADAIATYLDDREANRDSDDEKDWSCDNCGETLQDGSGVCVTCGHDHNEEEEEDENADDRPTDSVCGDCDQTIDYDTGVCSGCGRDWSQDDGSGGTLDAGIVRTVLSEDAERLLKQSDANDPV